MSRPLMRERLLVTHDEILEVRFERQCGTEQARRAVVKRKMLEAIPHCETMEDVRALLDCIVRVTFRK